MRVTGQISTFAEATLRCGIHDQESGGSQYHLGTSDFSVSRQKPSCKHTRCGKASIFADHFPRKQWVFHIYVNSPQRVYKLLGVPKFEPNHPQPDLWKQKAGCPRPLRFWPDLSIGQGVRQPENQLHLQFQVRVCRSFGNLKESERNELK